MTKPGKSFNFCAANGSVIRVGEELGRGGEGVVYDVVNRPSQVAKIYLAPIDSQKTDKLRVMVSQCTDALTGLAAWPSDLVLDHKGHVAGLIMRKVTGFRPVHELYTPKSRLQEFPKANWAFLIHAATNVARAFAVMHSHQIVIGDVNHGNVLVNDAAVCVLIDCDSFQVTNNGHRFLCEVGVSAYTPPELQGKDFSAIVRTENHDNFGLALLIFHLLLMGRHPFAGRFLGSGDMPVERAIGEYRFAFSAHSQALQMQPPPNSLALSELPEDVAGLFEQAFSASGALDSGRPKAVNWVESLEALSRDLVKCRRNSSHLYYKKNPKCPWCRIEDVSTVAFFLQVDVPVGKSDLNIEAVWTRITSIDGPGVVPFMEGRQGVTTTFTACQEAIAAGRKRWQKIAGGIGIIVAGILLSIWIGASAEIVFIMIWAVIFAIRVWKSAERSLKFRVAHEVAAAKYESLVHQWQQASEAAFLAKRHELAALREELNLLPYLRHQRNQALEKNRRQIQLHKWLDRHFIRNVSIHGIGPGRKALLSSYGIDTAADLNWRVLEAVHGISHRLASALMMWRDSIEAKFVFDPNLSIDPQEVAKIEREIGNRRHQLGQKLAAGIPELQIIRERTLLTRKNLQIEIPRALQTLMQSEADLNAC